jgi:pyrimidine-nucleoside phosphorylase
MESFTGYNVSLSEDEFLRIAREQGLVLAGQTKDLAPADGKLYALRDVTATVASLPLIASSIMSKKIAAGANGIVLDVKAGNGAFMTNLDNARELAQIMVDIGKGAGRDVIAVLSDMNQPLGRAVGNALEVKEAIETLKGDGPDDFVEHCLVIARYMLQLAGRGKRWTNEAAIHQYLIEQLQNGSALEKFKQLVISQGGDPSGIDDTSKLPSAHHIVDVNAQQSGYIAQMEANHIAQAALELGAGRAKKGDSIDLAVGVITHKNVGDFINQGDVLFTIHANHQSKLHASKAHLARAVNYSDLPLDPLPLFYDTIYGN